MTDKPSTYADVAVAFLSPEEGGRHTPPCLNNKKYRPHFRVLGSKKWLGVEFIEGPDEPVKPGMSTPSTVRLLYAPEVSYGELREGTKFEILEGPNVVGSGEVIRKTVK